MEPHIPFVYRPDPAAVAKEVKKLRQRIAEETWVAEKSLDEGNRQKAALCYLSAWEALEEICGLTCSEEDKLALAQSSWDLGDFEDVGVKEIAKRDYKSWAGCLWRDCFERKRLPAYREKAVMAGALPPDTIDYSIDENYLNRRYPEMTELAVALENYDILENDDGEILLGIHMLPQGDERQAILFCDGGEHAILAKGPYRLVICDFVHPEVREKLVKREEILCFEDHNPDEEKGEYLARVVNYPKTSEIANILLHRLKKIPYTTI